MKAVSSNPRNGGTQKGLVPGASALFGHPKSHSCRAPPRRPMGVGWWWWEGGQHQSDVPPGSHSQFGPGLGTGLAEDWRVQGLGTSFPQAPAPSRTPALRNSREPSIPLACHIQHRS